MDGVATYVLFFVLSSRVLKKNVWTTISGLILIFFLEQGRALPVKFPRSQRHYFLLVSCFLAVTGGGSK